MIIFSVLIPHYQSPDLLLRCLESIPLNSEIEVIVVDDHSNLPISFWEKCKFLRPFNFHVIYNKKNMGAGFSRNRAIDSCKGKWLLFCDADDFFLPKAFYIFFESISTNFDIAIYNIFSVYSDTLVEANRHSTVNTLFSKINLENIEDKKKLAFKFLEPFAKLYRKDFLIQNKIRFQEVFFSNDTMFSILVLLNNPSLKVFNEQVYCVTVSKGSLTNSINAESLFTRMKVAVDVNKLLDSHDQSQYQIPVFQFVLLGKRINFKYMVKAIIFLLRNDQRVFHGLKSVIYRQFRKINPTFRKHSSSVKKYKVLNNDED